jgi:hypothetical protein
MGMAREQDTNGYQLDDLPAALVEALKRDDEALPVITARVDRHIAALAREQFADRETPSAIPKMAWIGVAAAVAVAVVGLQLWQPAMQERRDIYADVDGSGKIDIADVLAIARRESLSQAEIDAFANRIVALNPVGDAS